jgi:serine/threonine protein kinase
MPDRPSDADARPPRPSAPIASLNALPIGTRLGEFRLIDIVGEGGFGIVYRAQDESLQRVVAIKEYMPFALAARLADATVAVKSDRHSDTFEAGRRSFINEARLLAQFDHPSLLKVYRFWEANGTAYMAMPCYQGATLKQALAELGGPPDEAWLRNLLTPLLDALEVLHQAKCFHRDVAPDNILLVDDDRPVLLDFGAARRVIGDLTHTLTVIVKPGYAPLEQYAESASLKQGPWTDLYALAGVMYFAISGRTPLPAVARVASDTMKPAVDVGAGRYSPGFLRAIDAALAVQPGDRPQSVAEFRRLLGFPEPTRPAKTETHLVRPTLAGSPSRPPSGSARAARPVWLMWTVPALALLGIAAAVAYFLRGDVKPPESVSASAGAPVIEAPPQPPTAPEPPFDPMRALDAVFNGRSPTHDVSVTVQTPRIRIAKDSPRFSVSSSRAGHVYLLYLPPERTELWLLFPNSVDRNNRISAGAPLQLPRPSWTTQSQGPAGMGHFVLMVSDSPRDFSRLELRNVGSRGFGQFPMDRADQLSKRHGGSAPLLAGEPDCRGAADAACSPAYGAARFSIEEVADGSPTVVK